MSIYGGAVWCRKDGSVISDDSITSVLDCYDSTPDGKALVFSDKLVEVETVLEWRRNYELMNNRFWSWCQSNCLVAFDEAEVRDYFGDTSALLDFYEHRIIWNDYFASKLSSCLTGSAGLADILDDQVTYEAYYGLADISNAYLFPPRDYLLKAFGGFDSIKAIKHEAPRGKHARVPSMDDMQPERVNIVALTQALEDYFDGCNASVDMTSQMVENAVRHYVHGDYDAIAIYESYRDDIGSWLAPHFEERYPEYPEQTKRIAVNRLAGKKMIKAQDLILKRIDKKTKTARSAPAKLDRERMSSLRAGSVFRP